jgi:hypothetical protein
MNGAGGRASEPLPLAASHHSGRNDVQPLTSIPFQLDAPSLTNRLRIPPHTEDARQFEHLVSHARDVAKPKALLAESFVEARGEDTVRIDGITFTSRALRKNLDAVERVFPFIATCGREVDLARPPSGDPLEGFWWEAVKSDLLKSARKYLHAYLTRRFLLGKTSTMSPGSGDATVWPIEQQRELFTLLGDVRGQIGVELTASYLMVPNKTVSGICFPTETDFRSCQVCRRQVCPSGQAPFDADLWQSIQGDSE